jgi:hypothetical protein
MNAPCHCCDGTGLEADHAEVGKKMRQLRRSENIGLRELAERMGISHSHLSCLEHGKRRWDPDLREKYTETVMIMSGL